VGRNETKDGLKNIHAFVKKCSHTNVTVTSDAHRYDLDTNSSINNEVKVLYEKATKRD
jgi:carbamoylphosphate synthase small subunit